MGDEAMLAEQVQIRGGGRGGVGESYHNAAADVLEWVLALARLLRRLFPLLVFLGLFLVAVLLLLSACRLAFAALLARAAFGIGGEAIGVVVVVV